LIFTYAEKGIGFECSDDFLQEAAVQKENPKI